MCLGLRSKRAHEPSSPYMAAQLVKSNSIDDLSSAFQSLSVHSLPLKSTNSIQQIQASATSLPTPPPTNPSFPPARIPTFPLSNPPQCRQCFWVPKRRSTVDSSNRNGNEDRPFYICFMCKKNSAKNSPKAAVKTSRAPKGPGWISWDDNMGVHHTNRPCFCDERYACRQDRAGVNSPYRGGGFWTCAVGGCHYLSYRRDFLTVDEARRKGFPDFSDGFEPWLLPRDGREV